MEEISTKVLTLAHVSDFRGETVFLFDSMIARNIDFQVR